MLVQKWRDLFFLHWSCHPSLVEETLPKGLKVDTYEDQAYIGIVPFKIPEIRPFFLPSQLGFGMYEINVRTYVTDLDGNKGVWFYSLDANHRLAVIAARALYLLPYFYSEIKIEQNERQTIFFTKRMNQSSIFVLEHENQFFKAEKDSLEHFLVERYQLFTQRKGKLFSLKVFHDSYDLAKASLIQQENHLFSLDNLEFIDPQMSPHLLYSPGVNVKTTLLHRVKPSEKCHPGNKNRIKAI